MFSLDKNLFIVGTEARARVQEWKVGKDKLWILIPDKRVIKEEIEPGVWLISSGGRNKFRQWQNLFRIARRLSAENQITEITSQDPFFLSLLSWLVRQSGQVWEIQLHGDYFSSSYYRDHHRWRYLLLSFLLLRADRVRVVGQRVAESVKKRGVQEGRLVTRPVSIPVSQETNALVREKKTFVFLGRLDPVKNLCWLIEVFADVVTVDPGCRLWLVGSGPEKNKLEKLIVQKRLENNVQLLGWVQNPQDYLQKATALLFPSLSEGYGRVVMEARAIGCPVIMADVGVSGYEVLPSPDVHILPWQKQKWVELIKQYAG